MDRRRGSRARSACAESSILLGPSERRDTMEEATDECYYPDSRTAGSGCADRLSRSRAGCRIDRRIHRKAGSLEVQTRFLLPLLLSESPERCGSQNLTFPSSLLPVQFPATTALGLRNELAIMWLRGFRAGTPRVAD